MNIQVSTYAFGSFVAVDDDTYDGAPDSNSAIGWGDTEKDAVESLRQYFELDENDEGMVACDVWLMAHEEHA